jgi:hypothetical protein
MRRLAEAVRKVPIVPPRMNAFKTFNRYAPSRLRTFKTFNRYAPFKSFKSISEKTRRSFPVVQLFQPFDTASWPTQGRRTFLIPFKA